MSNITPLVSTVTPVASTANAVGDTKSGSFTLGGGIATLSVRMQNGATAPTVPCLCNILVSHAATKPTNSVTPNADWFLWQGPISGGTTASTTIDRTITVDGVQHVCVSYAGNNQAMTAVQCTGTVVAGWVNP